MLYFKATRQHFLNSETPIDTTSTAKCNTNKETKTLKHQIKYLTGEFQQIPKKHKLVISKFSKNIPHFKENPPGKIQKQSKAQS